MLVRLTVRPDGRYIHLHHDPTSQSTCYPHSTSMILPGSWPEFGQRAEVQRATQGMKPPQSSIGTPVGDMKERTTLFSPRVPMHLLLSGIITTDTPIVRHVIVNRIFFIRSEPRSASNGITCCSMRCSIVPFRHFATSRHTKLYTRKNRLYHRN